MAKVTARTALTSKAMVSELVHGRPAHTLVRDHQRRAQSQTDGNSQSAVVEAEAQSGHGDRAQPGPRLRRARGQQSGNRALVGPHPKILRGSLATALPSRLGAVAQSYPHRLYPDRRIIGDC